MILAHFILASSSMALLFYLGATARIIVHRQR
jgi:hypothetical protein